ncbi:MAG: hypothetical protein GXP29_04275 [Planctomycetes bacterium]|nr:hypothetical protein [Planctomycetota bacterium]
MSRLNAAGFGSKALLLLACVLSCAGCSSVSFKRFASATRVDIVANPGWADYQEPFQTQHQRLKEMRRAACVEPAAIKIVLDILNRYEKGWSNYWAVPPESPPVVLVFHDRDQWLGTVNVYEKALGHVHSLIRRIPIEDAAKIVSTVCDFSVETGNLRGPAPWGGHSPWSRTSNRVAGEDGVE